MNGPLYKAVLCYDADKVPVQLFSNVLLEHPLVEQNREKAAVIIQRALDWLSDSGRKCHLVNAYDNTDHRTGDGKVRIVLNDRDTAIMMKLALA